MYQFITLFTLVLVVANAVTDVDWTVFKAKYKKVYNNTWEEKYRRTVYEETMKKIQEHNTLFAKGLKSFFMKENEFADMTHVELAKTMNGIIPSSSNDLRVNTRLFNTTTSLPREVNWVNKGYVTEVKHQMSCGSCWAFAATGAIEGAHKKSKGVLTSLSEQNLVDCSFEFGNRGCNGGNPQKAFDYVIANKGIDTERSYPYTAQVGPCRFKPQSVGARISSYERLQSGSEQALQEAVANVGPISAYINAVDSFDNYGGGVYDDPSCSPNLNHGVLVVGYGVLDGKEYWRVKNSWGTSWGMDGYILMSRNKNNQCGIANRCEYPIV